MQVPILKDLLKAIFLPTKARSRLRLQEYKSKVNGLMVSIEMNCNREKSK